MSTLSTRHQVLRAIISCFIVGIAIQFYAAGLMVFGASSANLHAMLGWLLVLLSIVFGIMAMVWRPSSGLVYRSVVLLCLCLMQPFLALSVAKHSRVLGATHVLVALAIFVTAEAIRRGLASDPAPTADGAAEP